MLWSSRFSHKSNYNTKIKLAHNNQPILSKKVVYKNAGQPTKEVEEDPHPSSMVQGPRKNAGTSHQGTQKVMGARPAKPVNNKINQPIT
jgi:hypothetical protein